MKRDFDLDKRAKPRSKGERERHWVWGVTSGTWVLSAVMPPPPRKPGSRGRGSRAESITHLENHSPSPSDNTWFLHLRAAGQGGDQHWGLWRLLSWPRHPGGTETPRTQRPRASLVFTWLADECYIGVYSLATTTLIAIRVGELNVSFFSCGRRNKFAQVFTSRLIWKRGREKKKKKTNRRHD